MLEQADVPASRSAYYLSHRLLNMQKINSITEHDKDFSKVYLVEKQLALEMMDKGDPELRAKAMEIVNAD